MKIILSGGGTLGPVTPLIALKELLEEKHPNSEFLWVGTHFGPEKEIVEKAGMRFTSISSGKIRRYLSFQNLTDLVRIELGFFQSVKLIIKEKPDLLITTGGFVSLPLHIAAWMLRKKTWIHQQDIRPTLTNKLLSPISTHITVGVEASLKHFPKRKTTHLGNPVRKQILNGSKQKAQELFQLKENLPTLFITGGGTGSEKINEIIAQAAPQLCEFMQIIHLTGKGRDKGNKKLAAEITNYHVYSFFTGEMAPAYAAADIVIARGGFGTMVELGVLGKPSIFIPNPGHQEENTALIEEHKAGVVLDQEKTNGHALVVLIKMLLENEEKTRQYSNNIKQLFAQADKNNMPI